MKTVPLEYGSLSIKRGGLGTSSVRSCHRNVIENRVHTIYSKQVKEQLKSIKMCFTVPGYYIFLKCFDCHFDLQSRVAPIACQRWRSTKAEVQQENVPETRVTQLPNGLRIASENSGGPTATVCERIS